MSFEISIKSNNVQDVIPVITGEATRHLTKRIRDHLETDKKSHIFAHLVNNESCKTLNTENCFGIINSASILFRLRLKGAMHVMWKEPLLNKQRKLASISKIV